MAWERPLLTDTSCNLVVSGFLACLSLPRLKFSCLDLALHSARCARGACTSASNKIAGGPNFSDILLLIIYPEVGAMKINRSSDMRSLLGADAGDDSLRMAEEVDVAKAVLSTNNEFNFRAKYRRGNEVSSKLPGWSPEAAALRFGTSCEFTRM
jgi:hypothetical protein